MLDFKNVSICFEWKIKDNTHVIKTFSLTELNSHPLTFTAENTVFMMKSAHNFVIKCLFLSQVSSLGQLNCFLCGKLVSVNGNVIILGLIV